MRIDGEPHDHGFVHSESGTPFARVTMTRSACDVVAGVRDLAIMKTTGSGFVDYVQDEYTTLPPTADRILATRLCATWRFGDDAAGGGTDFEVVASAIRAALLRVFAASYSYSVQDSMYRMGEAALAVVPISPKSPWPCPTCTTCRLTCPRSGAMPPGACSCPPTSRPARSKPP